LTIERRRCGGGFSYHGKDGRRIVDPRIVKRLASLAVPPAYADVVYAKDGSAPLQAMGRDAAGRWQYRYHPNWEKVRERRKTRHLVRLLDALPRIRRHLTGVLSTRQPTREFAMAAAIALIDATGIRAGTSRHARLSGARGAVTLLKSNVEVNGSSITLTFKAKGGKRVVKDVHAPRLVPAIKTLQRLPGRNVAIRKITMPPNSLVHSAIQSLFPVITNGDNFSVAVETASTDTFVYASVIENSTNIAKFVQPGMR